MRKWSRPSTSAPRSCSSATISAPSRGCATASPCSMPAGWSRPAASARCSAHRRTRTPAGCWRRCPITAATRPARTRGLRRSKARSRRPIARASAVPSRHAAAYADPGDLRDDADPARYPSPLMAIRFARCGASRDIAAPAAPAHADAVATMRAEPRDRVVLALDKLSKRYDLAGRFGFASGRSGLRSHRRQHGGAGRRHAGDRRRKRLRQVDAGKGGVGVSCRRAAAARGSDQRCRWRLA